MLEIILKPAVIICIRLHLDKNILSARKCNIQEEMPRLTLQNPLVSSITEHIHNIPKPYIIQLIMIAPVSLPHIRYRHHSKILFPTLPLVMMSETSSAILLLNYQAWKFCNVLSSLTSETIKDAPSFNGSRHATLQASRCDSYEDKHNIFMLLYKCD